MTREKAKQKLITFGVAEPTDEQITNFLNTVGAETKKEREKADNYKADAEKAEELGYSRYQELLKKIGDRYIWEAEQNALSERQHEDEDAE